VSQKLRRHVAHHPGVGHQADRAGPLRPQHALADAIYQWAFASLTASPGARAYYDYRRAAGDTHHAALRHLGNRLVGIPHGCLMHHTAYNENTAWGHRTEIELSRAA
jgi:hypothetical protein